MPNTLPTFLLLAATLIGLTGCQKKDNENGPTMLQGEWQLAVSGGGFTGQMLPVPAGQDSRCVFGPDSSYAEYTNGRRTLTSTFHMGSDPSYSSGPPQPLIAIKSTNSPTGQSYYRVLYITELTANKLNLTTGGGCALNSEYVRAKSNGRGSSF
jgi:hypothetical protein